MPSFSFKNRLSPIPAPVAAMVMIGGVYLLLANLLPADAAWCGDNSYRILLVQTLVRHHFADISFDWPGRFIDPALRFSPLLPPFAEVINGKAFTSYPVFLPAIAAPFYMLLGQTGLKLVPILGSLVMLAACMKLCSQLGVRPKAQAIAAIVIAFASPILFYSLVFWEHTLSLGLNLWAISFLLQWRRSQRVRAIVWAAIMLGASIWLRAENYLLAPAMMLFFMGPPSRKKLVHASIFVFVAFVVLVPLWIINIELYGHVLGLHVSANQPLRQGLDTHLAERALVLKRLFLNVSQYKSLTAFVLLPFLAGFIAALLDIKIPRKVAAILFLWASIGAIRVLSSGIEAGHRGAWLGEVNSLFPLCPLILVGLLPVSKNLELRILRLALIVFMILYALAAPVGSSQGFHWANRFLLLAYPLLIVIGVAEWANVATGGKTKPIFEYASISALVLACLILQIFSFYLLQSKLLGAAGAVELARAQPEAVIISEPYEAVDYLFPLFFDRLIFHVKTPQECAELISRLRATQKTRFLLLGRWGSPGGGEFYSVVMDRAYLAQPFSMFLLSEDLTHE